MLPGVGTCRPTTHTLYSFQLFIRVKHLHVKVGRSMLIVMSSTYLITGLYQ